MDRKITNIDDLFRERFNDYRVEAPADVWDQIEAGIEKPASGYSKPWYKYAAAIAVLIAVGAFFLFRVDKNDSQNNSTYYAQTIEEQEEPVELSEFEEQKEPYGSNVQNGSRTDTQINQNSKEEKPKDKVAAIENRELIASSENLEPKNETGTIHEDVREMDNKFKDLIIERFVVAANDEIDKLSIIEKQEQVSLSFKEKRKKEGIKFSEIRWSVGASISPSFSYRFLNSSPENEMMIENYNELESGMFSYSGGLNIFGEINKRWSFKTGIYYFQVGQQIQGFDIYDNVAYTPGIKGRSNQFEIENSHGSIKISSKYIIIDKEHSRVMATNDSKFFFDEKSPYIENMETNLVQSFEYIDVPFQAYFKMIDRKMDISASLGFSTSFLIDNQVELAAISGESIGKTEGIKNFNMTGLFSLSLQYPLTPRLNFHFEPTLKYFINSVNSSELKTHPYSTSLMTGINIRF